MLSNMPDRYGLVSRVLHWLIALGMLALVGLGAWMVGLTYFDPWYNRALDLHRSFGMIVLGLVAGFLVWKLVSPSPRLQDELRSWERQGARVAHGVLQVAMVVLPVSGYVISTSAGSGFPFLGLGDIPPLLPTSEAGRDLAIAIHYYAAYGVLAVAAVHAGASLKHQFVDRHGTLRRML